MKSARKFCFAALFSCNVLIAAPALAEETKTDSAFTVTGYAEGVSDYRWRGLSSSDGKFAIQGALNVAHSSGFYVNAWASSIKDSETYGKVEVDLSAGWAGQIAPDLTADVGVYLYAYPDGIPGEANVGEAYVSLAKTIGPVTGKIGANYAWKQDSLGGEDNLYVATDLTYDLPGTPVSLTAHAGYTDGAWSPSPRPPVAHPGDSPCPT